MPVLVRLHVGRVDGKPLDFLAAGSDNHRILVEVQPGTGPDRQVQVVIPVLPPPGEETGVITITTRVPGAETLSVPFRVVAKP